MTVGRQLCNNVMPCALNQNSVYMTRPGSLLPSFGFFREVTAAFAQMDSPWEFYPSVRSLCQRPPAVLVWTVNPRPWLPRNEAI